MLEPNREIGPAVGADFAGLRFEDIDHDAVPEMIVESSAFKCNFGVGPCYDAFRTVVKVCATCAANRFEIIDEQYLEHLTLMLGANNQEIPLDAAHKYHSRPRLACLGQSPASRA